MHQGHNVPWYILETHFTFTNDDKRFTPTFTGLVFNSTPSASSGLKHFIDKLISTIKVFSDTERKKYPPKLAPILPDDKVFSDALRDKHPEYLSEEIQPLSYWIKFTKEDDPWGVRCRKLMAAVDVLLYENEMSTLLMLVHHPEINMVKLHCHNWQNGPHIGFICSMETALDAYILFNTMEAVGCLMNGAYARTMAYQKFIQAISTNHYGYQVMHKDLLQSCGLFRKKPEEILVHLHYEKLQEYLRSVFAIMYRYDMLAREIGVHPNWDFDIKGTYPFFGRKFQFTYPPDVVCTRHFWNVESLGEWRYADR